MIGAGIRDSVAVMTARPILVVQNEADDPPGRLGDWLTAAGAELDVRAPYAGDAAADRLASATAGWSSSAARWAPTTTTWHRGCPQVRDCCAERSRDEVPTLGVCLGAQLLAVATGGGSSAARTVPRSAPS